MNMQRAQFAVLARFSPRRAARALPPLGLAALAAAYARTLAPSISWANNGADSGDLATAAATLGVAHPAGYPTYLLLARLFMLLPVGDIAYRANMLSAAAALLATLLLYRLAQRLLAAGTLASASAAGLAALALGTAPLFWSQAVIAEVYTLNALFAVLLLGFAAEPARSRSALAARGLLAGLALGNHPTIGLFVAAWLLSEGLRARQRLADILGTAGGLAAGLLVYLYLPLRAAAHPPVSWGGADTLAGFWWVLSGALYRPLAFGVPAGELPARLADAGALLWRQVGALGLGLALAGLAYAPPRARRFVWLSAGAALLQAAFAIGYNTPDYAVHLIPALLIAALWMGLGAAALLSWLNKRWRGAAPLAALVLAGAFLAPLPATLRQADASGDTRALDYALAVLEAAPPRAIVLSAGDRDSFALAYARYALGRRPDTAVLIESLLQYDWYRANARALYPALRLPDAPEGEWGTTLAAANPDRAVTRAPAP